MTAPISSLLSALKEEVDRVVSERTMASEDREELSAILIDSIHKTLKEIKLGADSDEFQELTVLNFVMGADKAGFDVDLIGSFVSELKQEA